MNKKYLIVGDSAELALRLTPSILCAVVLR